MRAIIFILSLGLSLSIGTTSIQAIAIDKKIKEESAPDLSWWPMIIVYLFIFYLIAAHGKAGCIIITLTIAMSCLFVGNYVAAFLYILLVIAIITSTSGGNLDPDDYDDVDVG